MFCGLYFSVFYLSLFLTNSIVVRFSSAKCLDICSFSPLPGWHDKFECRYSKNAKSSTKNDDEWENINNLSTQNRWNNVGDASPQNRMKKQWNRFEKNKIKYACPIPSVIFEWFCAMPVHDIVFFRALVAFFLLFSRQCKPTFEFCFFVDSLVSKICNKIIRRAM